MYSLIQKTLLPILLVAASALANAGVTQLATPKDSSDDGSGARSITTIDPKVQSCIKTGTDCGSTWNLGGGGTRGDRIIYFDGGYVDIFYDGQNSIYGGYVAGDCDVASQYSGYGTWYSGDGFLGFYNADGAKANGYWVGPTHNRPSVLIYKCYFQGPKEVLHGYRLFNRTDNEVLTTEELSDVNPNTSTIEVSGYYKQNGYVTYNSWWTSANYSNNYVTIAKWEWVGALSMPGGRCTGSRFVSTGEWGGYWECTSAAASTQVGTSFKMHRVGKKLDPTFGSWANIDYVTGWMSLAQLATYSSGHGARSETPYCFVPDGKPLRPCSVVSNFALVPTPPVINWGW